VSRWLESLDERGVMNLTGVCLTVAWVVLGGAFWLYWRFFAP
jgi:hypothetical protein